MGKLHIVVGGPPRSGTRFITDALNRRDDINILGEVPLPTLDTVLSFIADCDAQHEGQRVLRFPRNGPLSLQVRVPRSSFPLYPKRKKDPVRWGGRRVEMFHQALRGLQKIETPNPSLGITGFKTPGVEHHWRGLYRIYGRFTFLYCLRPFREHFLSVVARWPDRTIQQVARRYRSSIKCAVEMVKSPDVNLVAFFLADLETAGPEHLQSIAHDLGLHDADGWVSSIDTGAKANAAERFRVRKRTLTDQEEAFLRKSGLDALYSDFREVYGRSLKDPQPQGAFSSP